MGLNRAFMRYKTTSPETYIFVKGRNTAETRITNACLTKRQYRQARQCKRSKHLNNIKPFQTTSNHFKHSNYYRINNRILAFGCARARSGQGSRAALRDGIAGASNPHRNKKMFILVPLTV